MPEIASNAVVFRGIPLKTTAWEAMLERVQSCFELSIHFPAFFPANYGFVAVHGWFAIEINVWT